MLKKLIILGISFGLLLAPTVQAMTPQEQIAGLEKRLQQPGLSPAQRGGIQRQINQLMTQLPAGGGVVQQQQQQQQLTAQEQGDVNGLMSDYNTVISGGSVSPEVADWIKKNSGYVLSVLQKAQAAGMLPGLNAQTIFNTLTQPARPVQPGRPVPPPIGGGKPPLVTRGQLQSPFNTASNEYKQVMANVQTLAEAVKTADPANANRAIQAFQADVLSAAQMGLQ